MVCTLGFGKTEVAYLAGADQFLHGARHFFDGHVRIDAVLVEEVDGVDLANA